MSHPIEIPDQLKTEFLENNQARDRFFKLPDSHQLEYIRWIEEAKKEDTRRRRAHKTILLLTDSI